jgi:hypothetical protein
MRIRIGVVGVGLYLAIVPVNAQQKCDDLLRYAGERWSSKSNEEKLHSVANWFCSREFSSSSNAGSAAASAGIPIEGFLVGGGFSSNDSQFRRQQNAFCSSSQQEQYSKYANDAFVETINPDVARAVQLCLANPSTGFRVHTEETSDPLVAKLFMRVRGLDQVTLRSFSVSPSGAATCSPTPTQGLVVTGAGQEVACVRKSVDRPFTIAINATAKPQWDTPATVPAVKKWIPLPGPKERNLASDGEFSYSSPNVRPDLHSEMGAWHSGKSVPGQVTWTARTPHTVTQIVFTVEQDPAGETEHVLSVNGAVVQTFKGVTKHRQDLVYVPPAPIEGVLTIVMETKLTPSNVAWGGINIFGY